MYLLIINTFYRQQSANVKKSAEYLHIYVIGENIRLKIHDYNGRKNLCGNRIREARRKLKISQSDLAAQLQVRGIILERDSVSRMEIGTRFITDYELKNISEILGVSLDWLTEE